MELQGMVHFTKLGQFSIQYVKKACSYTTLEKLTTDKAMVKFKGRSSIKQYQPLKPIKQGFKIWYRADSDTGYISNFAIYTEK